MIKNIEWLKEELEKVKLIDEPHELNKIYYDEVLELIDQLDESYKPVIPDYVAEWIDTNKEKYDLVQLFWEIGEGGLVNLDVDRWIEENPNTFARAWLNGFTVEVKKYSVAVDHDNGDWTYASDGRNIFKTRFESDAIQLARLLGGRVIRYEKGE